MALNVRTLGTRALSALVFVLVLLGCLLWNYVSFIIFFFIVAMLGLNEFYKLAEKLNAKPYKMIGFLTGAFTYVSFIKSDPLISIKQLLYVLPVLPFIILLKALFKNEENTVQNAFYTLAGVIYSVLPFALLNHTVVFDVGEAPMFYFDPNVLLGTILLIWCNDTFAYLGGSIFGKHKMIERISPGKTWEGTVFGILMTFAGSFLIAYYFRGETNYLPEENSKLWLALGIVVPLLATLGDLVESMIKRQAHVKDTGSIMPGHGGILDRFDSLIFVAPFVFAILKLL